MAEIWITHSGAAQYRVEVREGESSTTHEVTASGAHVARYGGGAAAERLIEESFRFLLEREPKESILGIFELPLIERHFPESPKTIRSRLR